MARDGHLRNLVLLQANDDAAPRSGARGPGVGDLRRADPLPADRKSTRLNSSHSQISYAVFCLKKKKTRRTPARHNIKDTTSTIRPEPHLTRCVSTQPLTRQEKNSPTDTHSTPENSLLSAPPTR